MQFNKTVILKKLLNMNRGEHGFFLNLSHVVVEFCKEYDCC